MTDSRTPRNPAPAKPRAPDWRAIGHESGLPITSVEWLGEGWSSHAWLVNGEVVIKFPKRESTWPELEREIAFLRHARGKLPVAVAEHLVQVRHSAHTAHGYAVYQYVPGTPCDPAQLPAARRELIGALAGFLRALHSMEVSNDLRRLLPVTDLRAVVEEYLEGARTHVLPKLTGTDSRRLERELTEFLEDPHNVGAPQRFTHADLSADHLIMQRDRLHGVIDWDIDLGDPDYDFSYLYQDFGPDFVQDLAREYGHPDIERLLWKARIYTMLDQIETIAFGHGVALPGDTDESWVRLHALLRG